MKKFMLLLCATLFIFMGSNIGYAKENAKPKEVVKDSIETIILVSNGVTDTITYSQNSKVEAANKILRLNPETLKDIKDRVYGNLKPIDYPFGLMFGYIGIFIFWVISTYFGIKSKTNGSPSQFSFFFWVKDNPHKLISLAFVTLVILISLRFISELWGSTFGTMFTAFLVGLLIDFAVQKLIKLREKFLLNT